MYNIRTNILLDEAVHIKLKEIAQKNSISVGKLIRNAIDKYILEKELDDRKKLFERIEKIRSKIRLKGKVDYKKMVEEGRRY